MYFLKKNELVLGIAVIVTNKACVQLLVRNVQLRNHKFRTFVINLRGEGENLGRNHSVIKSS